MEFSLASIADSIDQWLNAHCASWLALTIEFVIVGVLCIGLFAVLGLVLIMMERKVSAYMQLRLGPNRVGPKGMFQTVADTLKLLVKEGLTPAGADKFLFNLAPFVVMIASMLVLAPIAFAKQYRDWETDRKSTRLNSSHRSLSRMPSSA